MADAPRRGSIYSSATRGERFCAWCGQPIAPSQGVYHADLSRGTETILSHNDGCYEAITALKRVYDRSARGRWRSRAEVLRLLQEHAGPPEKTED